ncbi:MAG: Clp1/GlmU family protein [Candidatus Bathyarchaeia archaeon]
MELTIEKDKTLITHGPATLTLLEGNSRCLGMNLLPGLSLTIRRYKALPIYCATRSKFDLKIGANTHVDEVEGDTIPEDWKTAVNTIIEECKSRKSLTVAVIGAIDTGKSTFTTFLANTAIQAKLRVNITDADLGQSDIGPPTTIGEYSMRRELCDLSREKPDRITFIGTTSPAHATSKILTALSELSKRKRAEGGLNIFNTDGWVEGEEATKYKLNLLHVIHPDTIVAIRCAHELEALLGEINRAGYEFITVMTPPVVRRRSREDRKEIREHAYLRYLQNSSIRVIPRDELRVRGDPRWQTGILVGLFDEEGELLGIGVLEAYAPDKGLVKIMTPVKGKIAELEFGQIIIKDGKETPYRDLTAITSKSNHETIKKGENQF